LNSKIQNFEQRIQSLDTELKKERRDSVNLKQIWNNSKVDESKLEEEKKKAIDLQLQLSQLADEMENLKAQHKKELSQLPREINSLKEEIKSLKNQRDSLEGLIYLLIS